MAGACAPSCAYEGGDCLSDFDCCGVLACGASGTCGPVDTDPDAGDPGLCVAPGDSCLDNSDCCSDACDAYSLTCY